MNLVSTFIKQSSYVSYGNVRCGGTFLSSGVREL